MLLMKRLFEFVFRIISGLRWLVSEHKKCVGQLEHLKSAIADMHRWIDLIHERGEAMYKAFAELRSHLEDIQSRIEQLHRANHDDRETTDRLKKELEDWKHSEEARRGTPAERVSHESNS